jgi:diguanylate cyclase (GGDEF)-like protein
LRLRSSATTWKWSIACLVIGQTFASLLLPKSYLLTAITDWISFALMLSACLAFGRNAFTSHRQQQLVWTLLGLGYGTEVCGQLVWMHWELIRKQIPAMSLGDACVFLAWIFLILGFALRPHVEPTKQQLRLGTLDLVVLLLAGVYLYLFLVIPWEYLAPDPRSYGSAYKFLALSQDVILLSIVALGWRQSSGRWRHFYILLTVIVSIDTVMEYVIDSLAEAGIYFSGGWYDSSTAVCLAGMTFAALMVNGHNAAEGHGDLESERYWRWASHLATYVSLILPLLTAWSFLDQSLPDKVRMFRIVLSLAAIVVFGLIGITKQTRLERELATANRELLEASLTDALTGVHNRRFFANSIEADTQQVLRSYANPETESNRNRDLVFYLIDIDHFKRINDEFGHQVGDQVLIEVACRINSAARLSDAVIRWGGEEFLLLSRQTDRKEAHVLAKRVLDSVGSEPYNLEGCGREIRVTCSLGWAVFPWIEADPGHQSHQQVLLLADYALYKAKSRGRNQAIGLMAAGETVRDAPALSTIYVNGTPTSPITTLGPCKQRVAIARGAII